MTDDALHFISLFACFLKIVVVKVTLTLSVSFGYRKASRDFLAGLLYIGYCKRVLFFHCQQARCSMAFLTRSSTAKLEAKGW